MLPIKITKFLFLDWICIQKDWKWARVMRQFIGSQYLLFCSNIFFSSPSQFGSSLTSSLCGGGKRRFRFQTLQVRQTHKPESCKWVKTKNVQKLSMSPRQTLLQFSVHVNVKKIVGDNSVIMSDRSGFFCLHYRIK